MIQIIYQIWRHLQDFNIKWLLFLSPVLSLIWFVTHFLNKATGKLNVMITEASAAAGSAEASGFNLATFCGMAEAFFPVSLVLSYIPVMVSLWVTIIVYRLIKSYIPTLS